ncbi:unnamed protein product [Brassica oleracea]
MMRWRLLLLLFRNVLQFSVSAFFPYGVASDDELFFCCCYKYLLIRLI